MNTPRLHTRLMLLPLAAIALSFSLSACSVPTPIERDDTGEVAEANESADVFALAVGDCTNDDAAADTEVTTVAVVPCADPHDNEVYLTQDLAGDEYPGDDEIATQADTICYDEFQGFVGLDYDSSRLDYFPYTPTRDSWELGADREVACLVYDAAGDQLTGSVAGIAE
ncbi:putative regulator of septum formation [Glaciihabitans tibetensis]|uniref:Putative regulator of septum formation n=1 Tax=Glaciihabitans tibetensis TaxID=1266600 RepID=A0A2T0V364_9MICO|nr:septum formation family protein [Glaciihabitans tibetensis]PRY64629.1 putative regulator of septum formation [Glaciihabitans tibetensis]